MKYCPTCETRYDEEILRFCMKDGTPLVDEDEPKFVEMPSESFESQIDDDDPGEVTIIRKNIPVPPPPPEDEFFTEPETSKPRIVVPMAADPVPRPRPAAQYQQPARPNTLKVVVLTIIGTVSLLALGALGLWAFMRGTNDNANNGNINANIANMNTNVNTNLGVDFNFNTNANFNTNSRVNSNVNTNTNTNTRTPTPTPTATPTPRPTESPVDTPTPSPTATRTPLPTPSPTTIIIRPGGSPTPRATPRQPSSPTPNRPGNN